MEHKHERFDPLSYAAGASGESRAFFARSRTFDRPSRIQPMACSTRGTGDPFMYWTGVFVQCLQDSVDPTAGSEQVLAQRLETDASRVDIFFSHRHAGTFSGGFWQVVRKGRPQESDVRRGRVLCAGLLCLVPWRGYTSTVAHLRGIWCHRWNGSGTWIHLAGFDTHQMVP